MPCERPEHSILLHNFTIWVVKPDSATEVVLRTCENICGFCYTVLKAAPKSRPDTSRMRRHLNSCSKRPCNFFTVRTLRMASEEVKNEVAADETQRNRYIQHLRYNRIETKPYWSILKAGLLNLVDTDTSVDEIGREDQFNDATDHRVHEHDGEYTTGMDVLDFPYSNEQDLSKLEEEAILSTQLSASMTSCEGQSSTQDVGGTGSGVEVESATGMEILDFPNSSEEELSKLEEEAILSTQLTSSMALASCEGQSSTQERGGGEDGEAVQMGSHDTSGSGEGEAEDMYAEDRHPQRLSGEEQESGVFMEQDDNTLVDISSDGEEDIVDLLAGFEELSGESDRVRGHLSALVDETMMRPENFIRYLRNAMKHPHARELLGDIFSSLDTV